MFHLFHGYTREIGEATYLDNGIFGIEVTYGGTQHEGTYFLFPQFDQNHQTYRYLAFDTIEQKSHFKKLLKIQWVGSKSAYQIALLPEDEVADAVERFDQKYFQSIPGVGPKTAKRILMEMKQNLKASDIKKLHIDEKLYREILESLRSLGYPVARIKKLLPEVPHKLDRDNLPDIMKWMVDNL